MLRQRTGSMTVIGWPWDSKASAIISAVLAEASIPLQGQNVDVGSLHISPEAYLF